MKKAKTGIIILRISVEEKKAIKEAAEKAGIGMSEYIRRIALNKGME